MSRLRILHVYKAYPPVLGGIEGHLELLARRQAGLGHEVTVLVTGGGPTATSVEAGVRVIRARRLLSARSTPLSPAQAVLQRRIVADLVHLQAPYPPGELAELARPRRPLVVTYQSDVVRQRWLGALLAPMRRHVLRRAGRVLVTSPRYAGGSPLLRAVADRCTVVPLGIDTDAWSPCAPDAAAAVRQRFGGGPLVVFLGRLRSYKGLPVLLEGMIELPTATLLVIGDGPERRRVERGVARLGLGGRVHLLGDLPASEVRRLATAAALGVLPSTRRSEAYGLALLELMACGLPVVSTELGTGTSWVNRDGETGRVVRAGDPGALAAALRELLGDEERRRRLGAAARQRVVAELSAETMVERTMQVYREVLAAPRG